MQSISKSIAKSKIAAASEGKKNRNSATPFLMNFVEKKKLYSLSQATTTSCTYANGMTPDD